MVRICRVGAENLVGLGYKNGHMSLITYWKTRGSLMIGAGVAAGLGLLAGKVLGVPAVGTTHAALLLQPSAGKAFAVVVGVLALAGTLGTLIAGRIRPDAGLFCGVFSLLAISSQTGRMRDVLFEQPSSGTYIMLAVETGMLAAVLGAGQWVLSSLVKRGVLLGDDKRDGIDAPDATVGECLLAVVATAGAFALLTWFLVPTDDKKQAIFGVGLAAFIAAAAVHHLIVSVAPAWPFWVGVLLASTGLFAYGSTQPGLPGIGVTAIPACRALPVDHASAGVAAAVLGYWYSRRWKRNPETQSAMGATVESAGDR